MNFKIYYSNIDIPERHLDLLMLWNRIPPSPKEVGEHTIKRKRPNKISIAKSSKHTKKKKKKIEKKETEHIPEKKLL